MVVMISVDLLPYNYWLWGPEIETVFFYNSELCSRTCLVFGIVP